MRRNNTNNVGDIIRKLMKNPKLADRLDELDALEVWKELIGKQLQNYIVDARMKKGNLLIKVKSAPLRNELSYKKTDLIKQINVKLGKEVVKEIVLKENNNSHSFEWLLLSINTNYLLKSFLSCEMKISFNICILIRIRTMHSIF